MAFFVSTVVVSFHGRPEFYSEAEGAEVVAFEFEREVIFPPPEDHSRDDVFYFHQVHLYVGVIIIVRSF